MDLFEKQAQLQGLFQTSPVDAAYLAGSTTGRKIAGTYNDLDIALLLLKAVKANEFFDYQVYFVSELSKALDTAELDVVILNQASLLQKYLVMALALPKPEAYHDILDALAGHGVIERALAYRLEHLANLRNLLAYDREQTDIDDVYGQIQTRVADLGAFADQVLRFIGNSDLS